MKEEPVELVSEALRRLRSEMADMQAGPSARSTALGAFRKEQRRRRQRMIWLAAAAVAACAVLAVLSVRVARRVPPPAPVAVKPATSPGVEVATVAEPTVAAKRVPRRRAHARKSSIAAPPANQREVATDFLAIPSAPPFDAEQGAQVIRVRLPRAAMASFGLPIADSGWRDRVPADVVVGGDGIARAVRFVGYRQ